MTVLYIHTRRASATRFQHNNVALTVYRAPLIQFSLAPHVLPTVHCLKASRAGRGAITHLARNNRWDRSRSRGIAFNYLQRPQHRFRKNWHFSA